MKEEALKIQAWGTWYAPRSNTIASSAFSDFLGEICQESGLCLQSKVCACDLNFETHTDLPPPPTYPPLHWPLFCPLCPIEPLALPYSAPIFCGSAGHEGGTYSGAGSTNLAGAGFFPPHNIQKLPRLGRLASTAAWQETNLHQLTCTCNHQNLLVGGGTAKSNKRVNWLWPPWQGTQRGY